VKFKAGDRVRARWKNSIALRFLALGTVEIEPDNRASDDPYYGVQLDTAPKGTLTFFRASWITPATIVEEVAALEEKL
jgi:hypothetical protein